MYRQHGYQFISLSDALSNPAPAINVPYARNTSFNAYRRYGETNLFLY
jgi:hypothetical protein